MPDRPSPTTEVVDRRAARWSGQRAKRRSEFVEAAIAAIAVHGPAVSTEQIAAHAEVARPQLYRHFRDAGDLHRAVALRAAELILAEMAPVLAKPGGAPTLMIEHAVGTLVGWLADHANLYRYVTQQAAMGTTKGLDVVADIKTTLGIQLNALLSAYLTAFGVTDPVTEPLAFGVVGFVESATNRWLSEPGSLTQQELVDNLSSWIWGMLDHICRAAGVTIDPDQPL